MGADLKETVAELVTANHILFDEGVVDAFGHVSVLHPERPRHFLLSRAMAPSQVSARTLSNMMRMANQSMPMGAPFILSASFMRRFIACAVM
jgi:hypothetical protein